jgi:hypothetical protein
MRKNGVVRNGRKKKGAGRDEEKKKKINRTRTKLDRFGVGQIHHGGPYADSRRTETRENQLELLDIVAATKQWLARP